MAFQYGGASATGKRHLDQGLPCEDAYQTVITDSGVVACVCDGAGSASRSAEGAFSLARNVATALSLRLDDLHLASTVLALTEAIEHTRDQLAQNGPLAEFHATLCGIALTTEQCLVFHLGDGVIMGINPDDWTDFVVSEPDNGEFAETTYFFTLPQWQQTLRVFSAPRRYRTWFLMSDGAASFAVKTSPWRPTDNFLKPVHQHLCGQPDPDSRSRALLSTLQSPQTDRITADDKTLVWVHDQGQN